jgi:cytochrome c oxidase subunit II
VELNLVSTDVIHTWDVPQLAPQRDAVPGKTNHVIFRADDEGDYRGQSATFSGQAYAAMRTEVEVVSPAAYENFIAKQKAEIQAAQDRVVGLIENGEVP